MKVENNVKITYKGCKNLDISKEEKKKCYFYSIKQLGRREKIVNHHIFLIDVSYSMNNEITELKERIKSTLELLCSSKNNYVSLITYSGHNEVNKIISGIKCEKTSYAMARIYEKIEEISTKGITVISEPLDEAIEVIKSLDKICQRHHILLFTDGFLVPLSWSCDEEKERCHKASKFFKDNNIFFNAIGLGKYYDRNFLDGLIKIMENSTVKHINEISNFNNTILNLINYVNNTNLVQIPINNNDFFILDSSKRIKEPSIIKDINKDTDNLIVTFDAPLDFTDLVVKTINKDAPDSVIDSLLYSLSLYHFNNEDMENAKFILSKTGDIHIFNKLINSFSFLERGIITTELSELIYNKKERFKNGKEEIKLPDEKNEPLCLLEVLREIIIDDKSKLLWDYNYPYKRIGIKKSPLEDRYKFIYNTKGYGNVVDVSIGSKKLNIGLTVEIKGQVCDSLSTLKIESKIYKEYNLIVNGNINTSELSCILSRKLKMKLNKEGIIKKTIKYEGKSICILDLTKIKITNMRVLNSLNQENIASYLYDIQLLSCKQLALNKHIKSLFINNNEEELKMLKLCPEEREARVIFKVNEKGVFSPKILYEKDNETPVEVYEATMLEWKIENFSKKEEETKAIDYYSTFINTDPKESYDKLKYELDKVKKEKKEKELLLNSVRISTALTKKSVILWDNKLEKPKRKFDNVLKRNMIVNGRVIVSRKNINNISIRQDLYTLLTKCN